MSTRGTSSPSLPTRPPRQGSRPDLTAEASVQTTPPFPLCWHALLPSKQLCPLRVLSPPYPHSSVETYCRGSASPRPVPIAVLDLPLPPQTLQCGVGPITAACAGFTRLRSLWVFGSGVPSPPSPLQMTVVPQDPAQSPSTLQTPPCATSAVLGARGPHPLAQSCSVPRRADLVEMSTGRCQPHERDRSRGKKQASDSHPKAPWIITQAQQTWADFCSSFLFKLLLDL